MPSNRRGVVGDRLRGRAPLIAAGPKPFAILAAPRTGSTWLCSLLNAHPDVVCHLELFNPERAFGIGTLPALHALAERDAQPLRWLDKVMRQTAEAHPQAKAIGFKFQFLQRLRVLEHLLLETDMPLVLLTRRNVVAQYALMARADATRRYNAAARVMAPERPVGFDFPAFRGFVERFTLAARVVREIVPASRLVEIDYTDVGKPDTHTRVLEALGLRPEPLTAADRKMGEIRTRDRFDDPDAVAMTLRQTVWSDLLEEHGT